MESKWFVIIFMLLSFLYRLYKKGQDNKSGEKISEPKPENTGSWGMEDLISQFEKKYGVENEENYSTVPSPSSQKDQYDYSEFKQGPEVLEPEKVEEEEYSVEKEDHHALKAHFEEGILAKSETVPANFDLEQMVIGTVILNRPEY